MYYVVQISFVYHSVGLTHAKSRGDLGLSDTVSLFYCYIFIYL